MTTTTLTPSTYSDIVPLVQLAIDRPEIANAVSWAMQHVNNKTNRPQRVNSAAARPIAGQFCGDTNICDTHFQVGIEISEHAPHALVVVAYYQGHGLLKQAHHQLSELVELDFLYPFMTGRMKATRTRGL